jgi:hypothetical protein
MLTKIVMVLMLMIKRNKEEWRSEVQVKDKDMTRRTLFILARIVDKDTDATFHEIEDGAGNIHAVDSRTRRGYG